MRRSIISLFPGTLALMSFLLAGGCGDDGSILIEDQKAQASGNDKKNDTPSANSGTGNNGGETTADAGKDGKDGNGVWGQFKGIFKKSDGEGTPPAGAKGDEASGASAGAAGAAGDENGEGDGSAGENRRRSDADEKLQDPDFNHAVKCIREQNYPEAKQLLLNVTQRSPDSSSAWRWLGDCHYNLLELPDAIAAYRRALKIHPENYFALRGEAFAHLHLGHEYWRAGKRQEAHEEYKLALKELQDCLRIYPADMEAMYGRSMAAEGASRRLYQNAVTQLRAGNKEVAESDARNCMEVVDEGIEAARQRMNKNPQEIGPRSIAGGLFQRRAILQYSFHHIDKALEDMTQAVNAYQSILSISPDNYLAKGELEKCQKMQAQWEKEDTGSAR